MPIAARPTLERPTEGDLLAGVAMRIGVPETQAAWRQACRAAGVTPPVEPQGTSKVLEVGELLARTTPGASMALVAFRIRLSAWQNLQEAPA